MKVIYKNSLSYNDILIQTRFHPGFERYLPVPDYKLS